MKTRTIFEKWIRSDEPEVRALLKDEKPNLKRKKDKSYADKTMNDYWIGFQIGARLME